MTATGLKEIASKVLPDQRDRVYVYQCDDYVYIKLDLHFLTVGQAWRTTHNVIAALRNRSFILEVVHGYIHGDAILHMIRDEFTHPRVVVKVPSSRNPGSTIMKVSGGAYEYARVRKAA